MLSIVYLRVDRLTPSKDNPFTPMQGMRLEMLLASIEKCGIMQPLLVGKDGEDTFVIYSGHNRYWGALKKGLEEVPCIIFEGDPADAMFDTNICMRYLSDEDIHILDKNGWQKKHIEEKILPRLLPELVEKYRIGELSPDSAITIAKGFPKENQTQFLNIREIKAPKDNSELEALQKQLETAKKESRRLTEIISQNDVKLSELRKKELDLRDLLEEKIEELNKTKLNVADEVRKEFEKELEEIKTNWINMSHVVKAKQSEIDALRENQMRMKDVAETYQAEINAQKYLRNKIEEDYKEKLQDYQKQLNDYTRPDLALKRLDNLLNEVKAASLYILGIAFDHTALVELAKKTRLVFDEASKLDKYLQGRIIKE